MTTKGTTMQAVGERIIVREEPPPETSKGGVFLTPSAREDELNRGVVVSVGPKVRGDVKVDDVVVFTKFDGREIRTGVSSTIVILHKDEIIGVEVE